MEFELINHSVMAALAIVVAAIILDAIFGVIKSIVVRGEQFDIRKLPQFVATQILPYAGGLLVLAVAARLVGEPYLALFYPVAAFVLAKYILEIKDKIAKIFGVSL